MGGWGGGFTEKNPVKEKAKGEPEQRTYLCRFDLGPKPVAQTLRGRWQRLEPLPAAQYFLRVDISVGLLRTDSGSSASTAVFAVAVRVAFTISTPTAGRSR